MQLVYLYVFGSQDFINEDNNQHKVDFINKDLNFGGEDVFSLIATGKNKYSLNKAVNDNYLHSFFSDNLQVSCVIGKNGAGKSTLLKLLQYIFNRDDIKKSGYSYEFAFWEWVAVYSHEKKYYFQSYTSENEIYHNKKEILEWNYPKNVLPISAFYSSYPDFSNSPNYDNPSHIDVSTDFLIHKKYSKNDNTNIAQITYFRREDIKSQLNFINYINQEKTKNKALLFLEEFIPKKGIVQIKYLDSHFEKSSTRYIGSKSHELYLKFNTEFKNEFSVLSNKLKNKSILNTETNSTLFKLAFFRRLLEVFYQNYEYRGDKYIDNDDFMPEIIKEDIEIINGKVLISFVTFFQKQKILTKAKTKVLLNYIVIINKLAEDSNFETKYNGNGTFYCKISVLKAILKIELEILKLLPYKNKISLFECDWSGISGGQKAYLSLFSRLHEAGEVLNNKFRDRNFIYFLLDEPEIAFHPDWQKEYLNNLINFLNSRFAKINKQLIITSHSPFVLSDMPDYAVIKLNKNQETIYGKKTFGANIYDLLADVFYMESGFIGEIAKIKIKSLAEFLTKGNKDFTKETALKTINIIEEPLIRGRLQDLFNQKYQQKETIETLKEKIKRLETQLENSQEND